MKAHKHATSACEHSVGSPNIHYSESCTCQHDDISPVPCNNAEPVHQGCQWCHKARLLSQTSLTSTWACTDLTTALLRESIRKLWLVTVVMTTSYPFGAHTAERYFCFLFAAAVTVEVTLPLLVSQKLNKKEHLENHCGWSTRLTACSKQQCHTHEQYGC